MKIGVTIGINEYPKAPLKGCVNDALDWAEYLKGRGFDVTTKLNGDATKTAILEEMKKITCALEPGDIGVIVFAGHGTWMPDTDGDEPDGRDEALCPIDMNERNVVLDDEIAKVWVCLRPGARVVFVTDACHSGTVFRFAPGLEGSENTAPRYLPPGNFVEDEALLRNVELARRFAPVSLGAQPIAGLVHMAACGDAEYACDSKFMNRPNGAFSRLTLDVLKEWQASNQVGTYFDLMKIVKTKLPSWEFPQTPVLNATPDDRGTAAFA